MKDNHHTQKTGKVIDALKEGKYGKAKRIVQHKVRSNPEAQAYVLGAIVGALVDPEGFHNRPDLASDLLDLFRPEKRK